MSIVPVNSSLAQLVRSTVLNTKGLGANSLQSLGLE
jgi:hypothetical protein